MAPLICHFEYPLDVQGNKMILVAQINFAEVPPLENFPTEGILQFFITDDEMLGMHDEFFESPSTRKHFRVYYHPTVNISEAKEVFDNIPMSSATKSGFAKMASALNFEKKTEFMPSYRVDTSLMFGSYYLEEYLSEEVYPEMDYKKIEKLVNQYKEANAYEFLDDTLGLGGYAYAIQEDVRSYNEVSYEQLHTVAPNKHPTTSRYTTLW